MKTLYRNLKPDDFEQVCLLPFFSYESALILNFTLIQNPNAAVVASASANVDDWENPLVHPTSAEADTTTNCASTAIPSVQGASFARPEESGAEASPLTSLPAPSTARAVGSASPEPTLSPPMPENAPALQENPGPARADPDEVSNALARADQHGVSQIPALVGSGDPSNANPQETELSSTKIPSIPQPAVQLSGKENPSE